MSFDLRSKLTSRSLTIIGLVLILAGNAFAAVFMNVKLHELIASVGALLLVVGVLQWHFDEEARDQLINHISTHIDRYLTRRDKIGRSGIVDATPDSKTIVSEFPQKVFIESNRFALGIHYSDGIIVRFESVIRERIKASRETQIVHSKANGISHTYLEQCLAKKIDLDDKVAKLKKLVTDRFSNSPEIKMLEHDRVLRYSFIYTDAGIWIVFLTNTDGYEPSLPAIYVGNGSPLFDTFKRDVADLGVQV